MKIGLGWILLFTLCSVPASGANEQKLPADIDFRQNPAYVILSLPPRLRNRAQEAYRLCQPKKADAAEFSACVQAINQNVSEEWPVYRDSELKIATGKIRFFEDRLEVSQPPKNRWMEWKADFKMDEESPPYQTVIERKKNLLRLPARPFPEPVWIDYKEIYGKPIGISPAKGGEGLVPLFPTDAGENAPGPFHFDDDESIFWVPLKIENGTATFKTLPKKTLGENAFIGDANRARSLKKILESGKSVTKPLPILFDSKGHLRLRPLHAC